MRYRLRTLLIVLAILPPLIAYFWPRPPSPVPIATVPRGTTAEVDWIEVNEFRDSKQAVFTQLLFWSRYPDGELHVREWRLIDSPNTRNFQIKHTWDGDYECRWTQNGLESRVRSPTFRKSKSTTDPELSDRKKLPKHSRQPLWH